MPLVAADAGAEPSEESGTPWVLWVCATACAGVGTVFLYSAAPGINWPISVLVYSITFVGFCTRSGKACRRSILLPLAIACFISTGAALTADPTYDVFIGLVTLIAFATAVICAAPNHQPMGPLISSVLTSPYATVLVTSEAFRRISVLKETVNDERAISTIRGVSLAVPITLLLALLLCQADPTFGSARDLLLQAFQDLSIIPRGAFFCALATFLVGALGVALDLQSVQQRAVRGSPPHPVFADVERLIITGSIAALFSVFLALQVFYLFGNPGGRSGSGVSYADAVHRGFVELNVASSVCAVVLFALRRYAVPTTRDRLIRALERVVLVQAQVLLVSAFYRVNLYEEAYGFTRLRLYVQIYAAVAFIALSFLFLELRGSPDIDRLLRRVLVVSVLAFGCVMLVNSDAWIAHKNLQRYAHYGQLDIQYLTSDLGPDAVPEIVAALPHLPSTVATGAANCLRARYRDYEVSAEPYWFECSLRRAALHQALAKIGRYTGASCGSGSAHS